MIPDTTASIHYLLPFRGKLSKFKATKNNSVLVDLVSLFLSLEMSYNPFLAKVMFNPGKICVFNFDSVDSMANFLEERIREPKKPKFFLIEDRYRLEMKIDDRPSLYGHVGVYTPEGGFFCLSIEDAYNDHSDNTCNFCNFKIKIHLNKLKKNFNKLI